MVTLFIAGGAAFGVRVRSASRSAMGETRCATRCDAGSRPPKKRANTRARSTGFAELRHGHEHVDGGTELVQRK